MNDRFAPIDPAELAAIRNPSKDMDWAAIIPVPKENKLPGGLVARCCPPGFFLRGGWRYKTPDGGFSSIVIRYNKPGTDHKEFRPFTFCESAAGKREWRCKALPGLKPLYGLDQLAARPSALVLVVEGEKKCGRAAHIFPDYVLTTSGSAKSFGGADWAPLAGREVVIWPDHDKPGTEYAAGVAKLALKAGARSVRIVAVPASFPHKWDLADKAPEGADLRAILEAPTTSKKKREARAALDEESVGADAAGDRSSAQRDRAAGDDEKEPPKETQAVIILRLVKQAMLFHDKEGIAFARMLVKGAGDEDVNHYEVWPIRSRGFRRWILHRFFLETKKAPSAEALNSALAAIEAMAHFQGLEAEMFLRTAYLDGKIFIDLCDSRWRAIEVSSAGWRIVDDSPVFFRRSPGMVPLPFPQSGGALVALRSFLNLDRDNDEVDDFKLILAWLQAALRGKGPYPVLALDGEQGSAKSTLLAMLRSLVDPSVSPLRTLPREDRDLFISAKNGLVLAFDNLSGITPAISDCLCRLATGGGLAQRQLYADDEEILFNAVRPIALAGIEEVAARNDLADRSLVVTLPAIPDSRRLTEDDLWRTFRETAPNIFGALLDTLCRGLKNLSGIRIGELPRMADFAKWASACEETPEEFLQAYRGNLDRVSQAALDSDAIATLVVRLVEKENSWRGTAVELLDVLSAMAGDLTARGKTWPATARAMSGRLRRAAPFLRKMGFWISFLRDGKRREILISKNPEPDRPQSRQKGEGFNRHYRHTVMPDDEIPEDSTRYGNDGSDGRSDANDGRSDANDGRSDANDGRSDGRHGNGDFASLSERVDFARKSPSHDANDANNANFLTQSVPGKTGSGDGLAAGDNFDGWVEGEI